MINIRYCLALPFFILMVNCNQMTVPDASSSLSAKFKHVRKNEQIRFPEVLFAGAEVTLIEKEPNIVTPTGIAVDDADRIWVIENHTHVRQDDYDGPNVDRILVLDGYINDNSPKRITEFATDFVDGMSLSLIGKGDIIIATRASIMNIVDNDGDFIADSRDTLISLVTEEKFSHNGMSGLVLGSDGKIYFQCGENFGSEYTISGSDGISIIGKEREGGSLYRCDIDGSNLERIGTAIWNCFAMTFDDYGNLFAVENDPDGLPPCRLLHIVKGGNYGFQFQHGRDGLSPLTSWFGEIPGTLPMVAGTGEAPTGLIHYGLGHFGESLKGVLLSTAWGDSVVQSFQLNARGSSFTSQPKTFIRGPKDFFPVALAIDSKGGILLTDWASIAYPVHGKGRIWRITGSGLKRDPSIAPINSDDRRIRAQASEEMIKDSDLVSKLSSGEISDEGKMSLIMAALRYSHPELKSLLNIGIKENNELIRSASVRILVDKGLEENEDFYVKIIASDESPYVIREAIYGLSSETSFNKVVELFQEDDPFINIAIITTFGKPENYNFLIQNSKSDNPDIRLAALLCLRKSGAKDIITVLKEFLEDPVQKNRITALKWISEDHMVELKNNVESSFANITDISQELFDTYMVTLQYMNGSFNMESHFMEGDDHITRTFYKRQPQLLEASFNKKLSYEIRARSLSSVNPNYADLKTIMLKQLIDNSEPVLQIEAVRSLGGRINDNSAVEILSAISKDLSLAIDVRLEAVIGLGNNLNINPSAQTALMDIMSDERQPSTISNEAKRSLELAGIKEASDKNVLRTNSEWRNLGLEKGDFLSGARVFFSNRYQCASCHRIDGRGGVYGPDLSRIGNNQGKEKIIESILNPDAIVTPYYVGYEVTTEDGDLFVGRWDKLIDSKRHFQMVTADGERVRIPYSNIDQQKILDHSLMPSKLHDSMSMVEFRNLIQYLSEQK